MPSSITEVQEKELGKFAKQIKDSKTKESILKALKDGKVNESNYEKSLEHCKSIIKTEKGVK